MRRFGVPLGLLFAAVLALPASGAWAQRSGSDSAARESSSIFVPKPVHTNLPDLGSSANALISRAEEYQVGRMMVRDLRNQNALLDDAETAEYLQNLGQRIAVEAQEGEQRMTFFAVRDRSLNAFALPGGFIGLHTGLMMTTQSEAELAGVVAHEIGHVVQRHIARAVQAQGRSSIASIAGMLGAILIGAVTGNADAVPGIIAIGQGTAMQQQINFTRMEEHEADRVGIGFLARAGYDPAGMAEFFETMMRQRGLAGADIPPMLLTHPVDTVRLAEARSRVAAMPPMTRRPDSESYEYIRERVRVLSGGNLSELRKNYARQIEADPKNGAARYAAALVEMQTRNPTGAVEMLEKLIDERPHLPLLHSALGQAQVEAGMPEQAVETFQNALLLSPRNVALTVRYSEALLTLEQPKKAHQVLLDLFNNVPPTPEQIKLIARAANSAGDTADAYSYMAEFHLANGDLPLAVNQLDLALATPGISEVQRKRFLARQDEVRGYLREDRRGRSRDRDEPRDGESGGSTPTRTPSPPRNAAPARNG